MNSLFIFLFLLFWLLLLFNDRNWLLWLSSLSLRLLFVLEWLLLWYHVHISWIYHLHLWHRLLNSSSISALHLLRLLETTHHLLTVCLGIHWRHLHHIGIVHVLLHILHKVAVVNWHLCWLIETLRLLWISHHIHIWVELLCLRHHRRLPHHGWLLHHPIRSHYEIFGLHILRILGSPSSQSLGHFLWLLSFYFLCLLFFL